MSGDSGPFFNSLSALLSDDELLSVELRVRTATSLLIHNKTFMRRLELNQVTFLKILVIRHNITCPKMLDKANFTVFPESPAT